MAHFCSCLQSPPLLLERSASSIEVGGTKRNPVKPFLKIILDRWKRSLLDY